MKTDIEIANSVQLIHINKIAEKLGIDTYQLEGYGKYKAKLPLNLIKEAKVKQSKLILVSAISPTPAGEGKTTTSIGLHEGLCRIGKNSCVVLREPSLGPVFGVKGGATGGGHAQVIPMEDINLHFTGDFSAIEKAHNLLAALTDNAIQSKAPQKHIDPRTVKWKRVMDMNDRALRQVVVALGGKSNGFPRETGFDITAASEIMAILCLSNNIKDLKEKLGSIYLGKDFDNQPVFARDIAATGAMAALLKDAVKPNLVQTLEGNPAVIHGGPFANIAQGTNTILATKMGMSFADYTVTEAGFGFDLGGEKFLDIKCRQAGFKPELVVMVATIRALKFHGGVHKNELGGENLDALKNGFVNLEKHLENVGKFGLKAVVAINRFPTDTEAEIRLLESMLNERGIKMALSEVWEKGGAGGEALAQLVVDEIETGGSDFKPLYELDQPISNKIEIVAKEIYGAGSVSYTSKAQSDLRLIDKLGLSNRPVCIAKTQYSFSDDPSKLGRPEGYDLTIREVEIAAGAGFVVPIAGNIMRMPGLPARPAAEGIDLDDEGNITGLF